MTDFAERDDSAYTLLHRSLLDEKGGSLQLRFLEATKSRNAFIEFVNERAKATDGVRVKPFDGALTEQSLKELPIRSEQAMYDAWSNLPPRVACRTSFWANVTLLHIESGAIQEAWWLAANGGRNESGEERIDRALGQLTKGRDGAQKVVDDCVRTVLRRMSGLPAARGNRSVYVDCPFARAWWRERLIKRVLDRDGSASGKALRDVVRCSQTYWERLVTMIVSRGSVFGSVDVQDAFINSMAKHFEATPNTLLKTANALTLSLRRLSNIAAARELGVLEFEEIGTIVDDLLLRVAHSEATSS